MPASTMTCPSAYITWNAVRACTLGSAGAPLIEKFFVRRLSANFRMLRRSGRRPGMRPAVARTLARLGRHSTRSFCARADVTPRTAATTSGAIAHAGSVRRASCLHIEEREHVAAVLPASLAVDRGDGCGELLVLSACQLENLPAFRADGGHRVIFFFDVQIALK